MLSIVEEPIWQQYEARYSKTAASMVTERGVIARIVEKTKADLEVAKQRADNLQEAKLILVEAARRTQQNIKDYVESLTTMALQSVYPEFDYKFKMELEIKSERSNCKFLVQDGDWEPYVPDEDQGGGILDVISYTLRLVLWSLHEPRSAPVLWLDEPFKWVGTGDSEELQRCIDMMQQTSKRLGIQLIIITHEENEITHIADRVFKVTNENGKSIVETFATSKNGLVALNTTLVKKRKKLCR